MKRAIAIVTLSILYWAVAGAAEPTLFMRVERKSPDDLELLRKGGVPVVMEMRPCLFVLGDESAGAALREKGYEVRVLDREAASADFVTVGIRPDSDVALVRSFGAVLLEEENWLLIRLPEGTDWRELTRARVFISRVPEVPADPPREVPATSRERVSLLPDPIVQRVVNSVTNTDVQQYWQTLVTNTPTGTRYSTGQGCLDAAAYCYNTYVGLGLPVQYQSHTSGHAPNVIGTHAGATKPGNVYLVVGHLDDLPASSLAPGADDNASGSVAVLQSAKALSCWGVRNTVKFLNVTGEEFGLYGSVAYAADAAARGENILGVLNFDMIGWAGNGTPAPENLELNYNTPSQWLAQRFADAAASYGTGLSVNPLFCPSLNASDHYPFWQRGWSALCGITDNEGYCGGAGNYPYYHTSNDTIANNGNPAFFYSVVRATVATLAELAEPFKITFDQSAYGCGAPVRVLLADRDLDTDAGTVQTVAVLVSSSSEPAGETLLLTEVGLNAMLFEGVLPTTTAPPTGGDGVLSAVAGDTITAQYLDATDCDGAINVAYSATAGTDCVFPVISAVSATSVTGNAATINWTTDEPASSVVHYGTSPPGGSTASSAALVTTHATGLTALAECSLYVYWVESADAVGNTAFDDAGGAYYTFETGKNVSPSFTSTDTPIAIPDSSATGATSTINVTDTKTVLEVKVLVNITHTYDGDIALQLIAPNGAAVSLATRRGGSGDNYVNTLFDDAAATAISAGAAPFTGSFRPESPLAAATGIPATGAWKLKVVDSAGGDSGTINGWTLYLRYPAAACGPHAKFSAKAPLTDVCSGGGPGSGNGVWDAGETVDLSVTLENDGTVPLTNVTATLIPTTPGVTMAIPTASFPSIPVAGTAVSSAPHFRAVLPPSLACGSSVGFDVVVSSDQGTWTSAVSSQGVGVAISGGGTALDESFASGIPATWTIADGGSGGGAAATWTSANPGSRTAAAPMVLPLAIVDSDSAGVSASQNEELITPVINLATATTAAVDFDHYFRYYSSGLAEKGDVDVRSSLTAGAWVNVYRAQGTSSANPEHKVVDISSGAAGASDVQIRFHYYDASYEWYWQIDNVKVTYTAPSGCSMSACSAGPSAPPPVPDGTFGQPVRATRGTSDGSSIDLTWDASTCTASDYHVLYGALASVSSYALSGARCDLGAAGAASWTGVPFGDLWFVVVSDDDASLEGSWGRISSGAERNGSTASGQCSVSGRNNTGTCP